MRTVIIYIFLFSALLSCSYKDLGYGTNVLRGVIIAILLRTFSKLRSIVISAAIFGAIHLLNILNPEYSTIWVLSQTVWAFGLGLMYAYLFVTTKTIWPLIVIHYLINGMVGVWLYGLGGQDVTSALYGIPFFGLIPAGLAILWARYLWKCWELNKLSI